MSNQNRWDCESVVYIFVFWVVPKRGGHGGGKQGCSRVGDPIVLQYKLYAYTPQYKLYTHQISAVSDIDIQSELVILYFLNTKLGGT